MKSTFMVISGVLLVSAMKGKSVFKHLMPVVGFVIAIILANPTAEATVNVGGSSWVWQNPLPQGYDLNAISCPSSSACFAVGKVGTILATASVNWFGQFSNTTQTLHGISCPSTSSCLAVGDGATVLVYAEVCHLSSPCQSSWTLRQATGIGDLNLLAVSCPSAGTCFAVGNVNTVFTTSNNGIDWIAIPFGQAGDGLSSISCTNSITCYAAGPIIGGKFGNVLKVFYSFNCSCFQTLVLPTGETNTTGNTSLRAISCGDTNFCVAVDNKGNSVSSVNGWAVVPVAPGTSLQSISCPDANECYAAGDGSNVYLTVHNGLSWQAEGTGALYLPLVGVSCGGSITACFAVGPSGAIVSNAPSSGINWASEETSVTSAGLESFGLFRTACPAEGICFAVGAGRTVFATTNGGATWTQRATGTAGILFDISCPSTTKCFAAGSGGTIVSYNGTTWSPQNSGTTADLFAISCPSTLVCYAGSTGIVATKNGGATQWTTQEHFGRAVSISGIACTSTTTCAAVGSYETIQTTTNGSTWSFPGELNILAEPLRDINCPTATNCVSVGDGGILIASTNGVTGPWKGLTSPTNHNLGAVSCLPVLSSSSPVCYVASDQGEIFSGSSIFTLDTQVTGYEVNGLACAGFESLLRANYECVAVGGNHSVPVIVAKQVAFSISFTLGTGELAPSSGSSAVGETTTFEVTWTVPSGKNWHDLQYLDLRLADDAGIGLWARFVTSTGSFELLDASGSIVAEGLPGTAAALQSPTAALDLSKSSFEGSGPTGPSVTVEFVVAFKPPAAGEDSGRVYNTELLATDVESAIQGPEQVGHWAIRATHRRP